MVQRPITDGPATAAAVPLGRSVTSYDVARHAGVSQSAVSRCFSPGASVSARTRARIMKAVDALGYQPNAIARSLTTKRSNLIAVIVANINFNPEFTALLSLAFAEHGLNTLLFTLQHESDADHVIDQLWQYRVDGVVSAARLSERHVEMLRKRAIPLIFLNRLYDSISVNSVCCDQAEGETWLVDRLCAAGHRRFAIVAGPDDSTVSRQRVTGAAKRLRVLGAEQPAVISGDFTYEGGRAALRTLAQDGRLPDAVICANDMLAIGCIDEARHGLKLKVPRDISIVGFDGSASGQWASYDLTTIRQPTSMMVGAAITMLVARIENPAMSTEKRTFSGDFIAGSSARLGKA